MDLTRYEVWAKPNLVHLDQKYMLQYLDAPRMEYLFTYIYPKNGSTWLIHVGQCYSIHESIDIVGYKQPL